MHKVPTKSLEKISKIVYSIIQMEDHNFYDLNCEILFSSDFFSEEDKISQF
jgi:hypothetical protein